LTIIYDAGKIKQRLTLLPQWGFFEIIPIQEYQSSIFFLSEAMMEGGERADLSA
jgi:hypothetical protein